MLPRVELATVDPAKVRDYLLSTVHPVGRFKAVVFGTLGYTAQDWERLRDDLLVLARSGETVPGLSQVRLDRSTKSVVRCVGRTAEKDASRLYGSFRLKTKHQGSSRHFQGEHAQLA